MASEVLYQGVEPDGVQVTFGSPDATGNFCAWHGLNVLLVRNNNGTLSRTVTVDNFVPCTYDPDPSIHDEAVVVAANSIAAINIGEARFKDDQKRVNWTYSDAAADLEVAVIRRADKS